MTIWNVPGTGYGQQIVNAGDGPTMVINRDETHQLFVGSDSSVATKNGTGDIDIIDPLSYIVYDGIQSKFAIADTPGIFVTVDCVQGATNWAPSPAQAAQQISLLGLATETTQLSVKGNTASVAVNTTGVAKDASLTPLAKDTTVNTVNTTLGSPAQDATVGGISGQGGWPTSGLGTESSLQITYDNLLARESITPNPDFTNGSLNGWNHASSALTTVSGAGLPNAGGGAPRKWAAKLVPNGGLNPAISSSTVQQCAPGDTIGLRAWVYLTGLTVPLGFYIQLFDSTGATLGFLNLNASNAGTSLNLWFHAHTTAVVPNSIGGGTPVAYAYAIYLNGTPAANVDTFYVQNFTAHISGVPGQASTAFDIAATGTPLLHGVNQVLSLPSTNISGGASGSVPVTFSKPGYTIVVSATFTGAPGATPFATIEMVWTDGGGVILAQENWSIPITNSGNINHTFGKGPVKSGNLTFRFVNGSAAQCAFTATIYETTHHVSRDDWRSEAPQFVNGFSAPTQFNPFGLMLGEVVQNGFAANGVISNLMPLYAGQVYVNISQSVSQAFSLTVNAQDPIMINSGGGNLAIFSQTFAAAKSFGPITINLPRCPCNFVFGNGPSLSNMTAFVNSLEYAS